MTLQREMGRNLLGVATWSSLGIRVMKVALRDGRIQCIDLDSSTNCQISSLIKSQKWWKKLEVKPSGPRALHSLFWRIACSTSIRVVGKRRSWLCSSMISFGICCRIWLIVGRLSDWSSCTTDLRWETNSTSMAWCSSSLSPVGLRRKLILLHILRWMVETWKNLVFRSPSFNHLIRDFCFKRISS